MMKWLGKVIAIGVVYAALVALLEFYFGLDIPVWVGVLIGGLMSSYID